MSSIFWQPEVAIMLLGVRWISQSLPSIMTRLPWETSTASKPSVRYSSTFEIKLLGRNGLCSLWFLIHLTIRLSQPTLLPHACILLTILRLFFFFFFFKLTSQLVAFDAAPFYSNEPLRFRGIADSLAAYHIEASECCLIHPHVGSLVESSSIQKSAWVTRQTLTFPLHRIDLIPGLHSVSASPAYGTMAFSPLADAIVS